MAQPKRVTITADNVSKVFASLRELVGKQVLVGIPEEKTDRQSVAGQGDISNAALGYIHEFGSPERNIPARAFLIPGVQNAEKAELYQMRKAANAALSGDMKSADQFLNAAGVVGSNAARAKIQDGPFAPLSPETIRRRAASRGAKSMRESEQVYFRLISQGVEPEYAQAEVGIKPLINTGQLRNSITYVVRSIK